LIAIADDSGLSVTALGGAPGVLSARWAQTAAGRDFAAAMRRIEVQLAEAEDRSAWFTCALAVAWPQDAVLAVEGRVHGTLSFPGRGDRGFGYDPIFVPLGGASTFGEMAPEDKDAISHRAVAFAKLKAALF
jgi:XTP/dITP diphosphohydrolase